MEKYQLFKSAYGDINNSTGTFYYDDFDILNASGVGECDPALPYPPAQIQSLRNMVSVAQREWSKAVADKKVKLKIWQECKSRIFCNAKSEEKELDAAEALEDYKLTMYNSAKTDLAQAESVNKKADSEYEQCYAREQQRIIREDKLAAQAAKLAAETGVEFAEIETEQQKVTLKQMESGKEYAIFGAIAFGILAFSFFGYKLLN